MFSDRIRLMAAPHWLVLFGGILAAWIVLHAMAVPAELRSASEIFGRDFWESFCTITPDTAGFLRVAVMWMLMSAAMMAPTALPALATYEDLGRSTTVRFWHLVMGYLVVWFGFAIAAAAAQMALWHADLVSSFGDSRSTLLNAALLAAAGAYQFTPLKDACLAKCRAPLAFFMEHWDDGAWRNGLRLGLVCLGCCWALMMLAFVGGVMNLAFMGLAMVLMLIEKLPDLGRHLTRPLGAALLIWATLQLL
ncbi:MAG: DUF2182 domain-containing protein [Pseudomonadota bacterium]